MVRVDNTRRSSGTRSEKGWEPLVITLTVRQSTVWMNAWRHCKHYLTFSHTKCDTAIHAQNSYNETQQMNVGLHVVLFYNSSLTLKWGLMPSTNRSPYISRARLKSMSPFRTRSLIIFCNTALNDSTWHVCILYCWCLGVGFRKKHHITTSKQKNTFFARQNCCWMYYGFRSFSYASVTNLI